MRGILLFGMVVFGSLGWTPQAYAVVYRVNTGTYVGDGAASRPINAVGFQPDVVIVKGELNKESAICTSTMALQGDLTKRVGVAFPLSAGFVTALVGDGFTVGSEAAVNSGSTVYHWAAFETDPAQMVVGTYLGTGVDNTHVAVGFQPTYVIVMSEAADEAVQRFSQQAIDQCFPFSTGPAFGDGIQNFDAAGFEIGLHASVNAPGVTYHYVAWAQTPRVTVDGQYLGDGLADRTVPVGVRPVYAIVNGTVLGQPAIARSDSMPVDLAVYLDSSAGTLVDGIREFVPGGMRVGSSPAVNSGAVSYYYTTFNSATDLQLTAAVSDASPAEGDTITYTWTLTNAGVADATSINVEDILPSGVTYDSDTPSQGTYVSGTGAWSAGALPSGANATLAIDAVVDTGTVGNTIRNVARILGNEGAGDTNAANDSSFVEVTVAGADLSLTKVVDNVSPAERDTIQFTLTLINNGPDAASQVEVLDLLPAGMTYLSDTPSIGTYTSGTGQWTIGNFANGANATLLLNATVDVGAGGSTLTNVATVTQLDNDPFTSNDTDSVQVDAEIAVAPPAPDLQVLKVVDNLAPNEGDTITYTVRVQNIGSASASGVQITDVLPPEVTYQTHNADRGAYVPESSLWSVGSLESDSVAVLSVTVTVNPGTGASSITNSAWVSALDQTDAIAVNDTGRVVIRTMEIQALPVGSTSVLPGQQQLLLSMLQVTNHTLSPNDLTGLSTSVSSPISFMRLWLDDGDFRFDPADDVLVTAQAPSDGRWVASGIKLVVPVEEPVVLFMTGDVSLTASPHGMPLTVTIQDPTDLTWTNSAAVVTNLGFPLGSADSITVDDLALAQLQVTPGATAAVAPGTPSNVAFDVVIPGDGGNADRLSRFEVQQTGSALSGADLETLRLLELTAVPQDTTGQDPRTLPPDPDPGELPTVPKPRHKTWKPVDLGALSHIGGGRWSTNGLDLAIPAGGTSLRVVFDVAASAADGRTVRLQLPLSALEFSSGRRGPEDAIWTSPESLTVRANNTLDVVQTSVQAPSTPVPRSATQLPVLGLELTARSSLPDQLDTLRLVHVSSGPQGFASDPHAQIQTAELWVDVDADGAVTAGDALVQSAGPNGAGEFLFGAITPLQIALAVNQPVRLLVTMTPHATSVRDAEQLRVRLEQATDVGTAGGLSVQMPGPIETTNPPIVDGQSAAGYVVTPVSGGVLFSGAKRAVVLDIAIPSNGVDPDVLQGLRIENVGTAVSSDVNNVELFLDDGDGVVGAGDVLVGELDAISKSSWDLSGIGVSLPNDSQQRFLVTIDVSETPTAGATFQARVPLGGIEVFSGNDGPNDVVLSGGNGLILSAADRVTWLAGIAGNATVPPNVEAQPVLIFEVFNGYTAARTLRSLTVTLTGSADNSEFGNWGLYPDVDEDGLPDASALAVASPFLGRVQFDGVDYALLPQQQHRLIVTYDAATGSARDGSTIDATLQDANAIRYSDGATLSAASFPLDSPGVDTIDGFIRAQVFDRAVSSRALGGGESDVLVLDFVLPSNGWQDDQLVVLDVEPVDVDSAAQLSVDLDVVRLWRESDLDPLAGSFDPASDVLLVDATAEPDGRLRFNAVNEVVPSGGQRFYVTVNVAPSPTEGRRVHFRIPTLGVDMQSDNDGPTDVGITGIAQHTFSSSDLLAGIDVVSNLASRGQIVSVRIPVRNQGATTLSGVIPVLMDAVPASAAALVSGPTPTSLTLAPSAEDVFTYQYRLDETGEVYFTTQIALPDSSLPSDVVTSAPLAVVDPPSGMGLSLLSSLPPSVYRGQRVTPLVWQLSHPDPGATSADILIDSVTVRVEDSAGGALLASDALDEFEIRTGGVVHAASTSLPAQSELRIELATPLVLRAGETIEMPFTVSIAAQATASTVRFRLVDASAVHATDANSGQNVALNAALPWNTEAATIQTKAPQFDITPVSTLPLAVNDGQTNVPAGRFDLSLPGGLNESEARLVQVTLTLADSVGASITPDELLAEVVVTSGSSELLRTSSFQTSNDQLVLPLTIPKLVVSGAVEVLELEFDLRSNVEYESFAVTLADTNAFVVRDGPSGELVPARLAAPSEFPWTQGPTQIQTAATGVAVSAVGLTPASSVPGQTNLPVAAIGLSRALDPVGSANVEIRSLAFHVRDDFGNVLAPSEIVTSARVSVDGSIATTTGTPPTTPAPVVLSFVSPLALAAGDSLHLQVEVDLFPTLAASQLRFSFETNAIGMIDANEPTVTVPGTGGLPFATDFIAIVALPNRVAFGPVDDPPANVARGANVHALTVRVQHPGATNEGVVQPQQLAIYVRDVVGNPLDWNAVLATATLHLGSASFAGQPSDDGILFDLTTAAPIVTGTWADFALDLEILDAPSVDDFRLALDGASLRASAAGTNLLATALDGNNLPWLSPSMHVASGELHESLSSYPNPYSPARDGVCNITFNLAEDARVTAEIFTLTGRRVCTLLTAVPLSAGLHDELTWNGRNGNGEMVRNGTYLLRIDVSGVRGGRIIRKLAVIR